MNRKMVLIAAVCIAMAPWAQAQRYGHNKQAAPVATGGDRDADGCKASAGCTYSQIRKDCIRVFEEKIQLKEVNPKGSYTSNVAVVFSDDNKQAEVFMPGLGTPSVVLTRSGKKGSYVWKKGGLLLAQEQVYVLREQGKLIFREE